MHFSQNHQRNAQFLQKLTFLLHSKSHSKVHVPEQAALFKVHFPPQFGATLSEANTRGKPGAWELSTQRFCKNSKKQHLAAEVGTALAVQVQSEGC